MRQFLRYKLEDGYKNNLQELLKFIKSMIHPLFD